MGAVTMRASLALFKRSAWKGPNVVPFDNLRPAGAGKTPPIIKTQARAASILPAFVGLRFAVHGGKKAGRICPDEKKVHLQNVQEQIDKRQRLSCTTSFSGRGYRKIYGLFVETSTGSTGLGGIEALHQYQTRVCNTEFMPGSLYHCIV